MTNVIRPDFVPDDVQRRMIDDVVAAARDADRKENLVWEKIVEAREAGIPDTLLCERTGRSRTTLWRRFGRRSKSDSPDPPVGSPG